MPHIIIKLYPGKSEEQKKNLVKDITTAVSKNLDSDESAISIAIEEVQKENWVKEVYKKDIIDNRENLYKEPGYKPKDSEFE